MSRPAFHSLYTHDFLRVAAGVPRVEVADPARNTAATLALAAQADADGAAIVAFPELGISAYAIDDLLFQDAVLDAVETGLAKILEASRTLYPMIIVGAPLRRAGSLFNCAVAIRRGRILGVVPKIYLPNYREFYEARHFTSGAGITGSEIMIAGRTAPFGVDLLFQSSGEIGVTCHIEVCEDLWTPIPPSSSGAMAGAEMMINLSASNIVIGKAETRRLLCAAQSVSCAGAYLYTAAGFGESTTDLAWDGHAGIFECGEALAETERFKPEQVVFADVDLGRIRQERMRLNSFRDAARLEAERLKNFRRIDFHLDAPDRVVPLRRAIPRFPFVPSNPARLAEDCYEAYNIQVQGLAKRLQATGCKHVVIGVSGGLDSTQALIVAARAFDQLGMPRKDILAYTLPGFATSEATKANAWALIKALGVAGEEIDIKPAARQMLGDLKHPAADGKSVYDVTFENVQAGLRTDYLFRLANHHGGLVVGTGDLSEIALGWCTYGVGDHMSHYNVNASVPKTLIQHLIRFVAESGDVDEAAKATLLKILGTEISPELVPGDVLQSSEQMVGPYALQDFNLYYVSRFGFRPSKIAFLALNAWRDAALGRWPDNIPQAARRSYGLVDIRRWLELFLTRFFGQSQFKRSAMPNGPKISSGGALSPRGDWRAPSDGNAEAWLAELRTNTPQE